MNEITLTTKITLIIAVIIVAAFGLGALAPRGGYRKQIAEYKKTIAQLTAGNQALAKTAAYQREINGELEKKLDSDRRRIENLEKSNNRFTQLLEFQRGIIEQERKINQSINTTTTAAGRGIDDSIQAIDSLIEDLAP